MFPPNREFTIKQPSKNFSIMYETDFPEYGQQCELVTPWRGYHRGTIVGRTAKGFIVQFSSGAEIEVYDDEIEFD
jgi:hypothetical protein